MPVAVGGREYADRWPTAWLCALHHQQWHFLLTPWSFAQRVAAIKARREARRAKAAAAAAAQLPLWASR